jgi:hypothetical protein
MKTQYIELLFATDEIRKCFARDMSNLRTNLPRLGEFLHDSAKWRMYNFWWAGIEHVLALEPTADPDVWAIHQVDGRPELSGPIGAMAIIQAIKSIRCVPQLLNSAQAIRTFTRDESGARVDEINLTPYLYISMFVDTPLRRLMAVSPEDLTPPQVLTN